MKKFRLLTKILKWCLNALIVHICKSFEQFVKKNLRYLEYNNLDLSICSVYNHGARAKSLK